MPNPLPPSAPSTLKYPFVSLRKSLRLLIDDNPEALEEVENDIGFVYSGYAPISIRLVQCVAQKGGVISNPAEKEKANNDVSDQKKSSVGKVQAHPIVGWKGFEDVVNMIPGQTVEIRHKVGSKVIPSGPLATLGKTCVTFFFFFPNQLNFKGSSQDHTTTTVVFFLGGCTYTEIAALRWVGRQNRGISSHYVCLAPLLTANVQVEVS